MSILENDTHVIKILVYELHMLGAGVAQVEAAYPNAAEVVNSALEYINKPGE